ncbi:hypothetical protein [Amycolatopsis alkalitolerans]|uniref:Uncharacterized protein n=1 Tax=Amycolatopsis alkalitolerans TaxID=2547244 RepID=A0A5C4M9J5_9PSEU|nr:hypothetical protein [Amycolatopsis alkalitolerans]TNC28044.1 hypothetical protein FG385_06320 [Amycolatopsis alkalitolerans]
MAGDAVPPRAPLTGLLTQLRILVTVLTVDGHDPQVAAMFAGLADTAVDAEPMLSGIDPAVLIEIRSALAYGRRGDRDAARADLLMASQRLATLLLERDRPRRAAAADEPTKRWSIES